MNISRMKFGILLIGVAIVGLCIGGFGGWYLTRSPPTPPESLLPGVYEGETIVHGSYGGSIGNCYKNTIYPGFIQYMKQKYNVTVDVTQYAVVTGAELLSKLMVAQAAGQDPPYDVIDCDIERILYEKGFISSLNYRNIPNAKYLLPNARPQLETGTGPGQFLGSIQLAYNPTKCRELGVNVTSWLDLGNPKFKDKVGFPSVTINTGTVPLWGIEKALGGDMYDPSLSLAWKWVQEVLLPLNPKFYVGSTDAQALFETGQVYIIPMWDGRAYELKARGVDLEVVLPQEKSFAMLTNIEMISTTKHTRLVEEFINYRLSPEVEIAFTNATRYSPTVSNVVVPASLKGLVSSIDVLNLLEVFPDVYFGDNTDAWGTKWTKIVGA